MIKLYTDCRTDMERASFFRSGKGWESGVVAKSLEGDLADVFAFRATVAAALDELRAEINVEATYLSDKNMSLYHSEYTEGVQWALAKLNEAIAKLGLEEAK